VFRPAVRLRRSLSHVPAGSSIIFRVGDFYTLSHVLPIAAWRRVAIPFHHTRMCGGLAVKSNCGELGLGMEAIKLR